MCACVHGWEGRTRLWLADRFDWFFRSGSLTRCEMIEILISVSFIFLPLSCRYHSYRHISVKLRFGETLRSLLPLRSSIDTAYTIEDEQDDEWSLLLLLFDRAWLMLRWNERERIIDFVYKSISLDRFDAIQGRSVSEDHPWLETDLSSWSISKHSSTRNKVKQIVSSSCSSCLFK